MGPRKIKSEVKEEAGNESKNVNPMQVKKFLKISTLMTEEQREAVEKYYKIDMSVVLESKVKEKMVALKESPKTVYICKICEATYPRFDKCQVRHFLLLQKASVPNNATSDLIFRFMFGAT